MAGLEKHIIELSARDSLSPTLKKIGTEAENAGRKAEQAGQRASRSMADWDKAGRALGAGIGALTLASVKLAGDSAAVQARLQQAIENTGQSYDDYADAIDRASTASLQLAFDDEDALDAISQLTDATGDASTAINDLAIAQDIARGRGIDLAAATQIVIAAETGRFQSLKRLGITVDENATKEEVLASLQAKYAGQAEAYADTTAASFDRLGNQIENTLESVGGKLDDFMVPLLSLSAALPVLTEVGGALGGASAVAGVAGMATALAGVATATVALAAPVGIATYLFIDQKNVVAEATKVTLENQKALEGYINYLNGINVDDSAIEQMSQQMKELLDWATKTSAAGFETIIDPDLNRTGDEFVATLGDMNDELRGLSPENLQAVVDLMTQLGVSVSDPSTWDAENISMVTQLIYLLSQQEKEAGYEAYELARGQSGANAAMVEGSEAAANLAKEMGGLGLETGKGLVKVGGLGENVEHATTNFDALGESIKDGADAIGGFVSGGEAGIKAMAALDNQLNDLADTLKADLPGAANAAYQRVVGFTSGMVNAIGTSKDWADALIAPVGTFSELDNMLASGAIDIEDYNEAQQAQIDITNDLARATAASNEIQVKQADTVADGAAATADYLETLAAMPEAQQAVALAWADTDIAGQAMQVADLAANFGNMNDAQQAAFENMVTSAAATNPALAAVLEDLGLIQEDVSDPTGYTLTVPTDGAQASIQDVVDAVDRLTNAILGIPDAVVNVTADTTAFWNSIGGIPSIVGDRYVNVHGVGFIGDPNERALGGVVPWPDIDTAALGRVSGGNVTMVGEHGRELVLLPGGAQVIPNHATEYRREAKGGGDIVINGDLHFHGVQDPAGFMRQMRDYSSSMQRP